MAKRSALARGAHLDARDDALLLQDLDKGGAVVGVLVQSLLEQDLQGTGMKRASGVSYS